MQTINPSESCEVLKPEIDDGKKSSRGPSSSFRSILGSTPEPLECELNPPPFFHDLNLDQIVEAITHGREEYNLKPFFYTRLCRMDDILYRQDVMRELESNGLFQIIEKFSKHMQEMRLQLTAAQNWHYQYSQERWFLAATETYCDAVVELQQNLEHHDLQSQGLRQLRDYLSGYAGTSHFKAVRASAKEVQAALSAVRYSVLIKGNGVAVRHYDSEINYTEVVERTFAKFQQGAVKDYRVKSPIFSGMNHVEAGILDRVAKLYPEAFHALDDFCARYSNYLDKVIADFDREVQFYIAFLEHAEKFKSNGLKFCYPDILERGKDVSNKDGFDLALAGKLLGQNSPVICNDFFLKGNERIFVVTGPNQGGKTTFARTFGQIHYLACLGCPVPGSEAQLFLFDKLFTHFEREEDISTLRGKMQDDLVRMHSILEQVTPKSIVIINEIFSSTSVKDGIELGRKIMDYLSRLDALCVCVTFLDELAAFNEKTVSMVAEVVPANPSQRTFKVERKAANGLAHALAIANKYRLTYAQLKERLKK